jgi:hypothetical protein
MSSLSMVEGYGQQIHFHSLTIRMQLATICQKLQLKWSPTHYCQVA